MTWTSVGMVAIGFGFGAAWLTALWAIEALPPRETPMAKKGQLRVRFTTRHHTYPDPLDNFIRYGYNVLLPDGRNFGNFIDDTDLPDAKRIDEIREAQVEQILTVALNLSPREAWRAGIGDVDKETP